MLNMSTYLPHCSNLYSRLTEMTSSLTIRQAEQIIFEEIAFHICMAPLVRPHAEGKEVLKPDEAETALHSLISTRMLAPFLFLPIAQ